MALRWVYGARPTEEFVADKWEDLRDNWLAHDPEAFKAVVRGLWRPNSREGYKAPAITREQLDWLRQRSNTARLREVVRRAVTAPALVLTDCCQRGSHL